MDENATGQADNPKRGADNARSGAHQDSGDSGGSGGVWAPLKVLKIAIDAVPATNYALAIAGIASASAIVRLFTGGDLNKGVLVLAAMIVFMIAMLVFARLVQFGSVAFHYPALAMLWSCVLLFILSGALSLSSVFFGVPINWVPQASSGQSPSTPPLSLGKDSPPPKPKLAAAALIIPSDSAHAESEKSNTGASLRISCSSDPNTCARLLYGAWLLNDSQGHPVEGFLFEAGHQQPHRFRRFDYKNKREIDGQYLIDGDSILYYEDGGLVRDCLPFQHPQSTDSGYSILQLGDFTRQLPSDHCAQGKQLTRKLQRLASLPPL